MERADELVRGDEEEGADEVAEQPDRPAQALEAQFRQACRAAGGRELLRRHVNRIAKFPRHRAGAGGSAAASPDASAFRPRRERDRGARAQARHRPGAAGAALRACGAPYVPSHGAGRGAPPRVARGGGRAPPKKGGKPIFTATVAEPVWAPGLVASSSRVTARP